MKKLRRIVAIIITFSITVTSICSTSNAKDIIFSLSEYTYDETGNITRITGTGNTTAITQNINCKMEYDAANRLICYNGKELTYDADGNMLQGVVNDEVSTLKYDCRNRLTKAGGTTYKYNAENTRISTETAEKTTEYVTDVSGTLSRVLAEYVTDKASGQTTYTIYVYGQGLISQENILDSENLTKDGATYNYYTYHYNHLGSTTAITDESGNIVERYTYGTYGELLNGTTEKAHYLYNGQYGVSTEDNGLYYMRQRYYNPEIKRFINQDIVTGSIGNSQSLNRYCYVQGNPVSMTDPFGLFPLVNVGTGMLHAFLNVAGMASGLIGTVADIINAGIYAFEGDVAGAISSGLSALPGVGELISSGMLAVRGGKAVKAAMYVRNVSGLIGNVSTFLRSGAAAISGTVDVIDHYIETGEIDWYGVGAVGLNMLAATASGKAALSNGNSIRKALSEDNVAGKIKDSLGNAAGKVKSGLGNARDSLGSAVRNVRGGKTTTIITHRGTNESIAAKIEQGYLQANYPIPNTTIVRMAEHSKKAVWVSEGKPTVFNRIFSGMVGKRGEASITFEVSSELVKRPDGFIKRWFGKSQRVIEEDVPIPQDAIVKFGGGKL